MNHPLSHILDRSKCLTKRQLTGYVRRTTVSEEETYAIETHLNSCALCSAAVDGMLLHEDEALEALGELSPAFIKEHFDQIKPQIHLNSVAAVAPGSTSSASPRCMAINWERVKQVVPLAAVLLVAVGLLWHWQNTQSVREARTGVVASRLDQAAENRADESSASGSDNKSTALSSPATAAKSATRPATPATTDDATTMADAAPAVALKDESKMKALPEATTAPVLRNAAAAPAKPTAAATPPPAQDRSTDVGLAATGDAQKRDLTAKARKDDAGTAPGTARAQSSSTTASPSMAVDHLAEGDAQFADDNYTAAIKQYKQESTSTDKARSQRARLMTARAYIRMGQYDKARPILDGIVREGGPEKRAAKRLLKDIE